MYMGERLMNNNTTNESVEEIDQKRVRSKKRYTNWKLQWSAYTIDSLYNFPISFDWNCFELQLAVVLHSLKLHSGGQTILSPV